MNSFKIFPKLRYIHFWQIVMLPYDIEMFLYIGNSMNIAFIFFVLVRRFIS